MALNSVVFAVRADPARKHEIDGRLARLAAIYGPLEPTLANVTSIDALQLTVGRIEFSPVPGEAGALTVVDDDGVLLAWGGPVPRPLRSVAAVLEAPLERLRELDRTVLLVAASSQKAVIAGPASGPAALYRARRPGVEAFASHALTASVLAGGDAAVSWEALPELLAWGAVGGTDTAFDGVEAPPSATRVVITPAEVSEESYWQPRDRWATIPEDEALAACSDALLSSLSSRLEDVELPHCALTAGIDSRVIAVALRELGPFAAFTIGAAGRPDVRGAQETARLLAVPHRVNSPEPLGEVEGRRLIERAALWSDGLDRVQGFARVPPPDDAATAVVTGNGGELGRAGAYRWVARNYPRPSRRQLVSVLSHQHRRIAGATRAAHDELDRRLARRLDDAAIAGHAGWRLLDVFHAEQRTRRFVRGRLARAGNYLLAGFSSPRLNQALVSLPLEDRLSARFHAGFLARFAPQLPAPPVPARQRRGIPAPARRLAHRVRSRAPVPATRWFLADMWATNPRLKQWIEDAVLAHPRVADVMDAGWAEATRAGFRGDDAHATELALQLASLVVVEEALRR